MRAAPRAVASTRRRLPTSASMSGSFFSSPSRSISRRTGSPSRVSPARYRSTASGTILPLIVLFYMPHTKIISTVGPACDSETVIDALIAAGTDIFRLNFSHGTHDSHAATFARVRAASKRAPCEVAILQDLGGPKIRTGRLEGGRPLTLKTGETLTIATGDFVGGPGRLSTTFE